MGRRAGVRLSPPTRDAPGDPTLRLRPHLAAALSLGASVSVHALRRAPAEAPDRTHRRPVLRSRARGNCPGGLSTVERAVDPRRGSRRPLRATPCWSRDGGPSTTGTDDG